MVKKAELIAEAKRYQDYIDDISSKTKKAADSEMAPLLQQKSHLQTTVAKLINKVQKRHKNPLQSDTDFLKAMNIFEKSKFKKLNVKIKDLGNRIDDIQAKYEAVMERSTQPIYKAQQEMRFLLKQEDLIEKPETLTAFVTELYNDILRLEQKPTFETEIKRKWNILQEVVGALLKDPSTNLFSLKTRLAQLRDQNERQLDDDQFDLTDLQALVPTVKAAAQKQFQAQLDAKAQKINVRKQFTDLLGDVLEKIPEPKPASLSVQRPASIRLSIPPTPKEPLPESKPIDAPKRNVAAKVAYFEKLAAENATKEELPKGPRKK